MSISEHITIWNLLLDMLISFLMLFCCLYMRINMINHTYYDTAVQAVQLTVSSTRLMQCKLPALTGALLIPCHACDNWPTPTYLFLTIGRGVTTVLNAWAATLVIICSMILLSWNTFSNCYLAHLPISINTIFL